jgi:hypothetical protein
VAFRTQHGRPVLLRCVAADCATATTTWLTSGDRGQRGPALTVDRAGRPVLVLTDPASGRVLLLRCADTGCARRPAVLGSAGQPLECEVSIAAQRLAGHQVVAAQVGVEGDVNDLGSWSLDS